MARCRAGTWQLALNGTLMRCLRAHGLQRPNTCRRTLAWEGAASRGQRRASVMQIAGLQCETAATCSLYNVGKKKRNSLSFQEADGSVSREVSSRVLRPELLLSRC